MTASEHRKAPGECTGMEDIRREIDGLDREIIRLIGQRYQYVLAASKFKTSEAAVQAPERFKSMLMQRRSWAAEEGLDPAVIEKLYVDLVNHFISEEMARWQSLNNKPAE